MNSGKSDESSVVSLHQRDTNDDSKKRKEQPIMTTDEIRQIERERKARYRERVKQQASSTTPTEEDQQGTEID